jgi:hypothetical protein
VTTCQKNRNLPPYHIIFRVTIRVIFYDFRLHFCVLDCIFAVLNFAQNAEKRLNCVVYANSAVWRLVAAAGFEPTTFGL